MRTTGVESSRVSVRDLTREFGSGRGIRGVSFDCAPGRVTGLIGPNGSGKSTTIRCMTGLIRSSGSVTFGGLGYADAVRVGGGIGVQLDAAGAHPKRTGRAHLRALAAGRGVHRDGVDDALVAVGLDAAANRRVGSYSLGMRQRLGLAAALLRRSSADLLDEPTNGLDPHGIRWLRERLAAEAAAGAAVFISSHALGDLEQVVDDLVILGSGAVRFSGTLGEVVARFGDSRVRARFDHSADRVAHEVALQGGMAEPAGEGALVIHGVSAAEVGRVAFRVGAPVLELTQTAGDLHEAYLVACAEAS